MHSNYKYIFENIPTPIIILDASGEIETINSAGEAFLKQAAPPDVDWKETLPLWLSEELKLFGESASSEYSFEKTCHADCDNYCYQITFRRLNETGGIAVTFIDFSRLRAVEDGLREMVQGVTEATGDAFFQFLVLHLAKAVDADYAFICEYADSDKKRVRSVATCADGNLVDNLEFDLLGTPCEKVVNTGLCCYPSGVQKIFPFDHLAIKLDVESYVGIPLINSSGAVLGPMAVFSRRPLRDRHLAESMLQIFATRASAELERKHAEEALKEAEGRLKTIVNSVQTGIVVIDAETHRIVEANEIAVAMIGDSRNRLIGAICHEYICPCSRGECPITDLNQVMDSSERVLLNATGVRVPIIKTVATVTLDGRKHLLESFVDITDRKNAESALKASEERYRMLVENQSDLVAKIDTEGKYLFVSPSLCEKFGKKEEELLGTDFLPISHPDDREPTMKQVQTVFQPPYTNYHENRCMTREGYRWIGWAVKAVLDDANQVVALVGIGRDITDRKAAEAEIEKLAYFDTLTGLPNRALLHDRMKQALQNARRDRRFVGIMFLDLDRFKSINDSLGHGAGDLLLKQAAVRLQECVRISDTIARLGGDEFVIVLPALANEKQVARIAEKILHALSAPISIKEQEVFTSGSIGIAIYPSDGEDVDTLLKHADMAMYTAKEQGRNNFQFFSKEMNSRAVERLTLENSLRRALERQEFFLEYQLQMDIQSNALVGVEALLRWRHPDLGLVAPEKFLSLAEETGLIIDINEWVLKTACQQNVVWQEYLPLRVAVNLSSRQFRQTDLCERVASILQETGLPANLLELEITESIIMQNAEHMIRTLGCLRGLGVTLAIDDFGTGYSSLSHLKHFPIDRLKIDRSFIREITTNRDDRAIAEAVIALAHTLGLKVVAEGVELEEQLEFLRQRGCDEIQGFYLSKPIRDVALTEILRNTACRGKDSE